MSHSYDDATEDNFLRLSRPDEDKILFEAAIERKSQAGAALWVRRWAILTRDELLVMNERLGPVREKIRLLDMSSVSSVKRTHSMVRQHILEKIRLLDMSSVSSVKRTHSMVRQHILLYPDMSSVASVSSGQGHARQSL
eukprot:Tamp_32416.p1 GENE.Tamp_32416~~Tamp_32416.p1  ORF type:complete len:139 (+),score=13.95 Tamp_32416:178-594(+)